MIKDRPDINPLKEGRCCDMSLACKDNLALCNYKLTINLARPDIDHSTVVHVPTL